MNCSEYIVNFFVKKNIKDVFFVDGSACASLIVAVAKNKNLRYYCPLHEQAGAFAVDGYFKATGKLSVMIATSGPGGQNLLNGIAAAYYDSIPALFITGQINSQFLKPSSTIRQHGFQENDIVSMAKPITKYAIMLKKPDEIRYELEKAYYLATNGRPGPVLIDIPMDIQKAVINEDSLYGYPVHIEKFETEDLRGKIRRCLLWLKEAKRPAILIGGGVWLSRADEEAKKLIKTLKIPFFVTWNMIDFCEESFPFYGGRVGTFGGNGRNFGIQNCDFLLTIGSRISGRITGGMMNTFARAAKKVIVDIDEEELKYQQVKGDLNICCDAKIFINEFLKIINESSISLPDYQWWADKVIYWRQKYPVFQEEYCKQKNSVNPYVFVKVLSEEMKEGDVLVHEAGGNCVITSQCFEAKPDQRVFTNNGNSSLGYALPAAIGACVATDKKVICICGDGGLNFNIHELQTIKHYKLPIKILVFNNYAFGITKLYRDTNFQSEYAGVDAEHGLSSPDFKKVADAYGIKSIHIKDHTELREKLKLVLESNDPILCDINMIGFYDYKPRLGWGVPIEDQYPFLHRDEFRENMIIEPIEGWENPVYPGK
ncbi:MAG: thiamine pyrophosphate-binding protein [Candidatus Methanoperedens sp.]|nr:thiamine pyrophosphate-binding protein [Candidatus Methanoperedens sp.]